MPSDRNYPDQSIAITCTEATRCLCGIHLGLIVSYAAVKGQKETGDISQFLPPRNLLNHTLYNELEKKMPELFTLKESPCPKNMSKP